MSEVTSEQLHDGIVRLKLDLAAGTEGKLHAYLALLAKWNRTYNLTAVRDEAAMIGQHLLDSLVVLPHLQVDATDIPSLVDVGSGGGLPGIPLAIAKPLMEVALIETSQKKASFLQQAKIELRLENVSVHCARVEDMAKTRLFEVVISRAFSSLAEFVRLSVHLLAPGGRLLAMKGVYPHQEIAQLPAGWGVVRSIPLAVPGLEAERHLIVIERS